MIFTFCRANERSDYMYSVTERIKRVKHPGRFIKVSDFTKIQFDDGKTLAPYENIDGSLMGRVVDYLTRAAVSGDLCGAFHYSIEGAKYADKIESRYGGKADNLKEAERLLSEIRGFDDTSIIIASRLTWYDLWYRKPEAAMRYGRQDIFPNMPTIWNIRRMVRRSMEFLKGCGGAVKFDLTFEPNGYTQTVSSGDGDFLTADTLWDMKVYRPTTKITKRETLQILMYWIMGQHSGQEIFKGVTKIGFFNPRMNTAYVLDVSKIPAEVIREVEDKVICY